MSEPKQIPPQVLQQVQSILSDHCKDYVLIALVDEHLWSYFSSSVAAYGMMQKTLMDIHNGWDSTTEKDEPEF